MLNLTKIYLYNSHLRYNSHRHNDLMICNFFYGIYCYLAGIFLEEDIIQQQSAAAQATEIQPKATWR